MRELLGGGDWGGGVGFFGGRGREFGGIFLRQDAKTPRRQDAKTPRKAGEEGVGVWVDKMGPGCFENNARMISRKGAKVAKERRFKSLRFFDADFPLP